MWSYLFIVALNLFLLCTKVPVAHLHGTVLNHLFLEVITGHSCAFFVCLFVFVHSRGNIWVWWNKFSMWDWHQAADKPTEKRGEKKHKKLSSMIWYDGISSLCFSWCKVMFDVFSSLPVFLFKIKKICKILHYLNK